MCTHFNHKGNFKSRNLFHSLLRANNLNVEVRTSFRNFFYNQSSKGHEGGSPPSAGLLRRPPTGSATTAGVARIRHRVRTQTVVHRTPAVVALVRSFHVVTTITRKYRDVVNLLRDQVPRLLGSCN
jgi:hypothetical protein